MTDRVIMHIGAPKAGTTYLQDVLLRNRERLAEAGFWYVGKHWRDHVQARLALIEHPRVADDPHARGAWDRAVREAMSWTGHTAIISHEMLGSATPDQAKRAMADLAPAEIHLVFTTRDFADHVLAVWQERLKWKATTPLDQWRPPEAHIGPHSDWSWRTMDPVGVIKRWQGELDPSHIHIVTIPSPNSEAVTLWERFAAASGIPSGLCDLTIAARTNQSLGAAEAELLRRVNLKVGGAISTPPEAGRWIRHYLAHGLLVPRQGERLTLRTAEVEELTARANDAVSWLAASGFDISGDLADLVPSMPRPEGIHPDEVDDAALLDVATSTIAAMLQSVQELTNERDAARADVRARKKAGREEAAAVAQREADRSRLTHALLRVRSAGGVAARTARSFVGRALRKVGLRH